MATEHLATLESSLDRVDVESVRTTADRFASDVSSLIDSPAVGAPLPFDGVSLPEGVETDPTPSELEAAQTGITAAAFAVADYGSVVIRASSAGEEPISLFADVHVAVVAASDVEPGMERALERFGSIAREEDADAVIATGPSATADMGALVTGAHGPKAVRAVVIEDR